MDSMNKTAGADMRMEVRRLADLIPADYNPREPLAPGDPEYEALKKSIELFRNFLLTCSSYNVIL